MGPPFRSTIWRDNLPPGKLLPTTLARSLAEEGEWISKAVFLRNLRAGRNVVAAEVHQNHPSSSDVVFDLKLSAHKIRWHQILADSDLAEGKVLDFQGDALNLVRRHIDFSKPD